MLEPTNPVPADVCFVFGGSHPGHWDKSIEAFAHLLADQFVVTGGKSSWGLRHHNWNEGEKAEAEVIRDKLLVAGVSSDNLFIEKKSTNSG